MFWDRHLWTVSYKIVIVAVKHASGKTEKQQWKYCIQKEDIQVTGHVFIYVVSK